MFLISGVCGIFGRVMRTYFASMVGSVLVVN